MIKLDIVQQKDSRVLDSYEVGPYTVTVLRGDCPIENRYTVKLNLSRGDILTAKKLVKSLRKILLDSPTLEDLLNARYTEALNILEADNFSKETASKVAAAATYKSMNLLKLMPFFLDEQVEEFFLDSPSSYVYLDHIKWGRCVSNIIPSPREVNALKTFVRLESGLRLDYMSPSLKYDLHTSKFHVRISLDIRPLAVNDFSLCVRKLRRKLFTIIELIRNNTLSPEAAAYLYACLIRRLNLTITGEPDSGKTTLLNALDILLPKHWRRIYIEDVVESANLLPYGVHQTKIRVEPFESEARKKKYYEVIKLLHRSPDWVYLGEVQTKEHSRALFNALTAGLHGFHTFHAETPEAAIRRWINEYKIPQASITSLNVIVHMKKFYGKEENKRRVLKICEVHPKQNRDNILTEFSLKEIFAWNSVTRLLELKTDLTKSLLFLCARETEGINEHEFTEELSAYTYIFERLSKKNIFTIRDSLKLSDLLYALYLKSEEKLPLYNEAKRLLANSWTF